MSPKLLLALSILAACQTPAVAPDDPGAVAARAAAIDTLAEAVDAVGLSSDAVLREAALLGSESGWDVVVVPAFPAPGEPFHVAIVATSPRPAPVGATLRGSTNGFQTWVDVRGAARATPSGHPLYLWGPVSFPGPTDAVMAFRVDEPATSVWLNRGGADYAVSVQPAAALSFVGDHAAEQDGLPVAGTLAAGHDTRVSVGTYPQTPDVDVEVRWTVDGVARPPVRARVEALSTGAFGNDTRWEATLPTAGLPVGAVVTWRVVAGSVGPDLVADDGGQPWRATVAPAPAVGWWDVGMYAFSSCHWDGVSCTTGWAWVQPLPDPLDATPGAYQAYAAAPYPAVEVYVPGVTDQPGFDPAGGFVRAEVVSPFFSGDPAGPWGALPMDPREVVGNNVRFDWLPRVFLAPTSPANGVDCPADGAYPYRFRLSTDGGRTWTELGDAAHPSAGAPRTMLWANQLTPSQLALVPAGGPAYADVAVGQRAIASFEVVNTSNLTLALRGFGADDPRFTLGWPGCPDASCELVLAPGARHRVFSAFAPTAPGPASATLSWEVTGAADCTSVVTQSVAVRAVGL